MACIDPDGTLTATATLLLRALAEEPLPPEDIAARLSEPIFRVRGNLREMTEADLIREEGGLYYLTEAGEAKV
jgi:predicted transcriptional regulator